MRVPSQGKTRHVIPVQGGTHAVTQSSVYASPKQQGPGQHTPPRAFNYLSSLTGRAYSLAPGPSGYMSASEISIVEPKFMTALLSES